MWAVAVAVLWAVALAGIAESADRGRKRNGRGPDGRTSWLMLGVWLSALFGISMFLPAYQHLGAHGQDIWDAAVLPFTLSTLCVGLYVGVRDARMAMRSRGRAWRDAAWGVAANAVAGLVLALTLGAWPMLLGVALSALTVAVFSKAQRFLHATLAPVRPGVITLG